MRRKLWVVGFGLLVCHLLFFSFQPDSKGFSLFWFGTIGYFLSVCGLHAFLFYLFLPQKTHFSRHKSQAILLASLFSIVTAFLALFRANEIDQFLLGGASAYSTLVAFYIFSLSHEEFGAVSEFFFLPFQLFSSWLTTIMQVFGFSKKTSHNLLGHSRNAVSFIKVKPNVGYGVIRGLIIAVPVIFVLFALLSSADPIFAKTISSLFHFTMPTIPDWLRVRLFGTIFFGSLLLPAAFMRTHQKYRSFFQQKNFGNLHLEAGILSGSVFLLLLSFLFVQFHYLFATVSETELHQFGVQTFSEYVKKGFSELLLVSVIVYGVAGFGMIIHRQIANGWKKSSLRVVNTALLVTILVFIFSIMRRVWLYEASHGLSRSRTYGVFFLIMLAFFTFILILRHYYHEKFRWYLIEAAAVISILGIIFLLRTDHLIAVSNPPTVNNEVDYTYLARLSGDGVDGWIMAYDHARSVVLAAEAAGTQQLTSDDIRQLTYAHQILISLRDTHTSMKTTYPADAGSFRTLFSFRTKNYNFAEAAAYEKLTATVPEDELQRLDVIALDLLNASRTDNTSVPLDRSPVSPLIH